MNFNFEAVTQTNLRYCGQLKSTFAAVAALALCTASMGAELVPPLTLSCGLTLPASWESGDVYNILANGTAFLANEKLRHQGKAMLIGKWQKPSSSYSITWNGVVRSSGQVSVFSDPKTMTVNFVRTGKASNGEFIVEMRTGDFSQKCLLGK